MKRIISIICAAVLLAALWACGAEEPVAPTTIAVPETTVAETTTEEPTTEEPTTEEITTAKSMSELLSSATVVKETDRVVVRLLNLSTKESQALKEQLNLNVMREEWKSFAWNEDNLRISDTKRLVTRHEEDVATSFSEIVLLDERSGKESVLLQNSSSGNSGACYTVSSVINERYFSYLIGGYGWYGESGIYDLKEMKNYPTKFNGDGYEYFIGAANGTLFYWEENSDEWVDGRFLWKTDITMLDKEGFLQTVEILQGIDLGAKDLHGCDISRDGKYYVMSNGSEVVIVDIEKREVFYRMDIQDTGGIYFSGNDTVYLTNLSYVIYMEIKIK